MALDSTPAQASHAHLGIAFVLDILEYALGNEPKREVFPFSIGARTEQNPFSGELVAMANVLRNPRKGVATLSRQYQ